MIRRLFLDHPASVDESYGEHMRVAGGFGVQLLRGAIGCFLHALIPAVFTTTGSSTVMRLHARLTRDPERAGKRPEYEI